MSECLAIPETDVEPWNRQPGETAHAYHAFNVYRNLPPPRTVIGAIRLYAESTKAAFAAMPSVSPRRNRSPARAPRAVDVPASTT